MMASDDKKTQASPTPKKEGTPKNTKNEGPAKSKDTSDASPSKAEGGETAAAAPTNYSRGEGQKPVTKAYKENWNAIFATTKKKRR
jgi:hypothetical protein